jgi:hypothetical protein
MNGRMASLVTLALSALAISGCGEASPTPDAFLGAYDYQESNTFTITGPMASPPTAGTADGTLTITAGTAADYLVTIDGASDGGGGTCALEASRGSATSLTFAAGQTCAVNGMGATGTATLTSGTGTLAGTTLTLHLAYAIKATSPQGSFTATTVDEDTATRQ